jgi:lysozyme
MILGCDLSHNNSSQNVDLATAQRNGIQFVIHKATQGISFVDPMFKIRQKECADLGIPFGAYHFGTGDDPQEQIEHFLSVATGVNVLALDFEKNTTPGETSMNLNQMIAFLADIAEDATTEPNHIVLYTGGYFKDMKVSVLKLAQYPLWLAEYGPVPHLPMGFKDWKIWQFSSEHFQGLGLVDLDRFNGDLPALQAFFGGK